MASFRLLGLLLLLPVTALAQRSDSSRAIDTVVQLYKDFAWETLLEEPLSQPGLIDQPRSVLARYFDDSLTTLILADRACVARKRAICNLDFLPLWDAQDIGARGIKVLATPDPSVVHVQIRYSRPVRLVYQLRPGPSGWRIHDIKSPDWSLLALLSRP